MIFTSISTMIVIFFASPRDDREAMLASSIHSMLVTTRSTFANRSSGYSSPVAAPSTAGSCMNTTIVRASGSSLERCGTALSSDEKLYIK